MNARLGALLLGAWMTHAAIAAEPASISRLAAGPGGIVFVADWKSAAVHAIDLGAPSGTPGPYNVVDLDVAAATALHAADVTFVDMIARGGGADVLVAVAIGDAQRPALLSVTPDGRVRRIDLASAPSTTWKIPDAYDDDATFWDDLPIRSFTVTDMQWHDGELFVSGLSNQDFSSTLWRTGYPFGGDAKTASIEMFHTTHDQIETRAPIMAFDFATLDGEPHLIAAYTCTPLVTVPLKDLVDGAHVRGKTVAELGYANTPVDLLRVQRTEGGATADFLLLINRERSSNLIPTASIAAANAKPGLTKFVPFGQITGVDAMPMPYAGVTRIDHAGDQLFVALRTQLGTGTTQLVSFDKSMHMRITDFISEYRFPGYAYGDDAFQRGTMKPAQDMLMRQEGEADRIKP